MNTQSFNQTIDKEGHYDLDGVSLTQRGVVVGSGLQPGQNNPMATKEQRKYSAKEIETELGTIENWVLNARGRLQREYKFNHFAEAFSFMTHVAFVAEKLDHHPDWSNSYNRVKIELHTHDVGGLTEKDFEFARRVEAINWT